jgi:DNA-binding CsgD family transcriptional regulator/tetratricopeptide (TPR) repeat protein
MAIETRVPSAKFLDRRAEREALDGLLADARAGRSRAVVLRGEAGVGKSTLLRYLVERVGGWHVARAEGVESEMELAYSGLHQLCGPMLANLERLPAPQRDALAIVFGRSTGPAPDRFLVGLATLTLLADVAERDPLICIVDDAQWLDGASAQILGFVARRLLAERIVLVFAARTGLGDPVLSGLPELSIGGLGDSDARALLLDNVHAPLDAAVCERIIAESHGNPLALLELPRTSNVADLAGGFGLPGSHAVPGKIEQSYARRLDVLPPETRLLVLAAAAEPLGDPVLLHRAAETLGIDVAAADPAVDAGLLYVGVRVEFAHPLVRSAAYRTATAGDRHRVHRALADATDAETDPDRRAWHLANAAPGPDEAVAYELERSATRAQARGGVAAAAAFLQRAVTLTVDPARCTERALAAAQASLHAGAFDTALDLVTVAEAGSLDDLQQARAGLLRGQIAFASNVGRDAPPLLLEAAKRLESVDVALARETYLDAWGAALFAGRLASAGGLLEVSQAARAAPRPGQEPRPSDLLLDGLATLITDGRAAARPTLRRAASAFAADERSAEENLRWGWLTTVPSNVLWDDETLHAINVRQLERARAVGALVRLPIDLTALAVLVAWWGDFASAASAIAEADEVTEATGTRIAPFSAMLLAALRGQEAVATPLIEATIEGATAGGQGIGVQFAQWVGAILFNGLGRYERALSAAQEAANDEFELFLSAWALPELIEASIKSGKTEIASGALERLTRATAAAGTGWAMGIEARSRALLETGESAESSYREAIDRLGRTRFRPELARAHLLYGEWLRRENRHVDARDQLRTAHELLTSIGMEAFSERARRELVATGEKVRAPSAEARDELTPQEEQIARLARKGLSNPEIGATLYLSPRTIEWHLHKVFAKLGIKSRSDLRSALPMPRQETPLVTGVARSS